MLNLRAQKKLKCCAQNTKVINEYIYGIYLHNQTKISIIIKIRMIIKSVGQTILNYWLMNYLSVLCAYLTMCDRGIIILNYNTMEQACVSR